MRTDRSAHALAGARVFMLATLLWTSADALAQSVHGSVERASGGPASYAIVAFSQNGQEKARAITDSAGNYYIRAIPSGTYDVTIMSKGGDTKATAKVPAAGATLDFRTR